MPLKVHQVKVTMTIAASKGVTAESIADQCIITSIILDVNPELGTPVKIEVNSIDGTATETTITAE